MVAFFVSAANIQDQDEGCTALEGGTQGLPFAAPAIADGGYQGEATAAELRAQANLPLEIAKRSGKIKGFAALPKRWIPRLRENLAHLRLARLLPQSQQKEHPMS